MSDAPDLQPSGHPFGAEVERVAAPHEGVVAPEELAPPADDREPAAVASPSEDVTAADPGPPLTEASEARLDPGPIEEDLAAVDAALARLDAGSYGTCEVCRDPLDDAVLEAEPTARFCAGHLTGTLG